MKNFTFFAKHKLRFSSGIAVSAALFSGVSFSGTAVAQTAPPATGKAASSLEQNGDIVVTARRKSEDILKTPVSIRALTADEIAARGVTTIQDIAQSTPGLNVQSVATQGGRADRSFTSIQLRGFVPSTSSAQTTSIFIDGAPVSVATAMQALTNPERVEVIKGPQSALFGRQTFAGALNIVTKTPSNHLTGSVVLSAGTRANYDVQGEVSAPLIKDVLSFRASFRALGKHGSYKNAFIPSETLGDQSTKTGSLAIEFKPTSNLTFKAFGLMTELNDGPAATGLIASKGTPSVAGFAPGTVIDQHNCTITSSSGVANPFFCGVAPGLSPVTPSANTANTAAIVNFLAQTKGRVLDPDQGVKGYGLVNHFYHLHFNADWVIGDSGVTLSSLTAFNHELKAELADLDNYYSVDATTLFPASRTAPYPEGFYNFPFMIEGRSRDFSQEFRASLENGGPLHASAGGSYLIQRNQNDSGSPYLNSQSFAGAAQSRTYGIFGSLGYDFSSHFTLSGDARYQIDKVYAFAGMGGIFNAAVSIPEGGLITSKVFKNFLPRVIAQYNFDRSNMVYASYSKGVNPGDFNTTFITSPEPLVRETAVANGFNVAVNPEKITNYEIGAKGRLFGMMRYDVAAYVAIWTNQIQSQSLTVLSDGRGPSPAGTPLQVVARVNSGRVRVSGLEANLGFDLTRGLSLDVSGAYVRTFILSAVNLPIAEFYNIPAGGFRGNENPFVSKYSANASLAYDTPLNDHLDVFGRADFTYKSGGYADIANVVRAPDLTQVNLRAGVRNDKFSLEGYITNAFNNRAYYSVGSAGLYLSGVTAGTYGALVAQLRDLRTVGLRATFNF